MAHGFSRIRYSNWFRQLGRDNDPANVLIWMATTYSTNHQRFLKEIKLTKGNWKPLATVWGGIANFRSVILGPTFFFSRHLKTTSDFEKTGRNVARSDNFIAWGAICDEMKHAESLLRACASRVVIFPSTLSTVKSSAAALFIIQHIRAQNTAAYRTWIWLANKLRQW